MDKIKLAYNSLPTWLKIALLNGGISTLVAVSAMLVGETSLDWTVFGVIWVGAGINILTHLKLSIEKP